MKYILVLLISFAFGQITESEAITGENREFQIGFSETSGVTNTFEKATMLTIPSNAKYFQVITLGDILNYAEECYNDSTEVEKHIGNINFCWGMSYGYGKSYCQNNDHDDIKVWTHKTPTFQGFIEWLKRGNNER